ncbi:Rieske (2Fe-2S) protein [Paractinoplanes maris]|uniref:Rieske (2Fe-2S) protein n=1 Tax=Paractinoplanes maris TaxID=1734446 RepID=UPI0020218817|nr:Rieske 2Fe-2S domain-containing protein [Actinoplanes maris]
MTVAYGRGDLRTLGPGDAVPDDCVVAFYLDDLRRRVSVVRVHDHLYAFDDLCPCGDNPPCPLSGGRLTGTTIMCQCHGSQFDITTGSVLRGPARTSLRTYQASDIDGSIRIRA